MNLCYNSSLVSLMAMLYSSAMILTGNSWALVSTWLLGKSGVDRNTELFYLNAWTKNNKRSYIYTSYDFLKRQTTNLCINFELEIPSNQHNLAQINLGMFKTGLEEPLHMHILLIAYGLETLKEQGRAMRIELIADVNTSKLVKKTFYANITLGENNAASSRKSPDENGRASWPRSKTPQACRLFCRSWRPNQIYPSSKWFSTKSSKDKSKAGQYKGGRYDGIPAYNVSTLKEMGSKLSRQN